MFIGTSRIICNQTINVKKVFNYKKIVGNCKILDRQFSVSSRREMKLIQFTYPERPDILHAGIINGDKVVDLNNVDSQLPLKLIDILRNEKLDHVKKLFNKKDLPAIPLKDINLAAPITDMDKIICIGLNYKDHCEEQNLTIPEVPMFFSKFASVVIGPKDPVRLRTDITKNVDWEVELVAVIGKKACNVKAANAYEYILGYTVAQDISARDWQKKKNGGQFLLGKSMDTFCPIGPWIVTSDEIADPQKLDIKCSVNGMVKQHSNTEQLINKIPDVIERLSSVMTLLPGDIILTGTPGGVGMYRNPPEYLKPGDLIESEIQCIGKLITKIVKF